MLSHGVGTVVVMQEEQLEVEVIRSARRRKTVEARMVGGVMRLLIPARMSKAEEQHWIEVMSKRLARKRAGEGIDLADRARRLAARFGLPEPKEIRWVDNQRSRWGSCTPSTGTIRLSSRMVDFPPFVVDHVIVHELAHLVHCDHGPAFKALIEQDPMKERATGFLLAKGLEEGDDVAAHDPEDVAEVAGGQPVGAAAAAGGAPDAGVDVIDLVDDGSGQLRIA